MAMIVRTTLAAVIFVSLQGLAAAEDADPADEAPGGVAPYQTDLALRYGMEPSAFTPSVEESAFFKAFLGLFPKGREPRYYPQLAAVAREHSESLAKLDVLPRRLDSARLRPIMWKHGVGEFQFMPVSLSVKDPAAEAQRIKDVAVSAVKGAFSACGAGAAKRGNKPGFVMTLICVRRGAEVEPFTRKLAAGSVVVLKGRLAEGFARPRIFVSQPSGLVSKIDPAITDGAFKGTVRFDGGPGKYLVEVMATGPTGPEIAVLAPVYIETYNDDILADIMSPLAGGDLSRGVDEAGAESMMYEAINRERNKLGMKALAKDGALAALAKAKSATMAEKKMFGHDLAVGKLDDNLKTAGMEYKAAGENLALNSSPKMAHYMLMNSPAHRANILNPAMTHCGVGVIYEAATGEYYVTEILLGRE